MTCRITPLLHLPSSGSPPYTAKADSSVDMRGRRHLILFLTAIVPCGWVSQRKVFSGVSQMNLVSVDRGDGFQDGIKETKYFSLSTPFTL